jgi:hypothetical protein
VSVVRLAGVRRRAALFLLLWSPVALSACGDTLQTQPVAHSALESLIGASYPVYWVGASFSGLSITEVVHDPGGAYSLQYGTCVEGGQSTCTPTLRIVTSPDNSFLPGGSAPAQAIALRGVRGVSLQGGHTIAVATGGVVIDIYAHTPTLARSAAQTVVPINEPAAPGDELPAQLPDTGYAQTPLRSQTPSPVQRVN